MVSPILEGVEGFSNQVMSAINAGDNYQTISDIVPIRGGDAQDLVHKEGEVWLVDFWATWCPPCQAPMAHNQEMLEKRKADWGGKVRIIGISIDSGAAEVVTHVDNKGWTSVEHYHRAKSNCSDVYKVNGVPHVMLIDTKGKIVYKGHPASRPNLEADFDALLKGETLDCTPKEDAADGDSKDEKKDIVYGENEEDLSSERLVEINKEIDAFKESGKEIQADEGLKATYKNLRRAFCVFVMMTKYYPVHKKTVGKFENYRVLVGPKDDVEKTKAFLEEKVKGSFKVQMQVQGY